MPNPASTELPNPVNYDTGATGLVTDSVTGLMWQRDVPTGIFTQSQADAYCAATFKGFGGFSDWRLPKAIELVSIVDFTRMMPATNTAIFPDTPNSAATEVYWSSMLSVGGAAGFAWFVNYADGNTGSNSTLPGSMFNVRCVRPAKTIRCFPAGIRYQNQNDGTTLDAMTGLTWQSIAPSDPMPWEAASAYCSKLGPGFRLPSVNELQTIVDRGLAIPGPLISATAFPNTPASYFWTSSPFVQANADPSFPSYWIVDFMFGNTGGVTAWLDSDLWYARCVR